MLRDPGGSILPSLRSTIQEPSANSDPQSKSVWSGLVWSVHVVTSDFGLMGNPFSARICRFLRAANLQLLLRRGQCGVRVDRYPGGSILPSLRTTIQAPSSPPRINSNPKVWTGLPEEKLFFLVDVLRRTSCCKGCSLGLGPLSTIGRHSRGRHHYPAPILTPKRGWRPPRETFNFLLVFSFPGFSAHLVGDAALCAIHRRDDNGAGSSRFKKHLSIHSRGNAAVIRSRPLWR